jgi:hypothetical protein
MCRPDPGLYWSVLDPGLYYHDGNQVWSLGIMRGHKKALLGDVDKFNMAVFKKHDILEM